MDGEFICCFGKENNILLGVELKLVVQANYYLEHYSVAHSSFKIIRVL